MATTPTTPTTPDLTRNPSKLLRFIDAARKSPKSPVGHVARFYKFAEKQIAGPWWKAFHELGTRDPKARMPISPLGEAFRTYFPHLIGDSLQIMTEPGPLGDRGASYVLQSRLRQWAFDAGFAKEREKRVMSSIIAASVDYVSRRDGGTALATEAGTLDLGEPCVQSVPIGRLVVDPNCDGEWEEGTAIGHWIEVDRESMLAAGIGTDNPAREAMIRKIKNIWEDQEETRELNDREHGRGDEDQYIDDKILLWEMCFRYRGVLYCCTLPPVQGEEMFVVDPYPIVDEPEGSRYVTTFLNTLPWSSFPVSPAMVLMDAHLGKQAIAARLLQQAEEVERKYVGEQGMQQAMMRLKQKGGEEFIVGPGKIQEFIRGGMIDPLVDAYAFFDQIGQKVGPNTDTLAGTQSPSKTATASSIDAGNGAVVIGIWKQRIYDTDSKVLRRVAALLRQGGDTQTFMVQTPAGPVPIVWDAPNQDISYDQYRYRIRPTGDAFGMDPRAKLRSLVEICRELPPLLQFFAGMLGAEPQKVLRVISDLASLPELDEMLPSGDFAGIQQQLFAMLAQNGQAMPTGMGAVGQMGGMANGARMQMGMPQTGTGAFAQNQLASPGPMTGVGQLNSNLMSGRVPA